MWTCCPQQDWQTGCCSLESEHRRCAEVHRNADHSWHSTACRRLQQLLWIGHTPSSAKLACLLIGSLVHAALAAVSLLSAPAAPLHRQGLRRLHFCSAAICCSLEYLQQECAQSKVFVLPAFETTPMPNTAAAHALASTAAAQNKDGLAKLVEQGQLWQFALKLFKQVCCAQLDWHAKGVGSPATRSHCMPVRRTAFQPSVCHAQHIFVPPLAHLSYSQPVPPPITDRQSHVSHCLIPVTGPRLYRLPPLVC